MIFFATNAYATKVSSYKRYFLRKYEIPNATWRQGSDQICSIVQSFENLKVSTK